jgi:hypothetical protein
MEQMFYNWLQGSEHVGKFFAEPNRTANWAVAIAAQVRLKKFVLLRASAINPAANPTTEKQPLRFSGKTAPSHLFGLGKTLRISAEGIREGLQVITRR